jgi:hypothetical protein
LEKNLWVEFLKIDKKNASILMEIGRPEIVGDRKHLAFWQTRTRSKQKSIIVCQQP